MCEFKKCNVRKINDNVCVCECVSIHSVRAVKQSHWTVKAAHFIVEGILTEYFNIKSMYICRCGTSMTSILKGEWAVVIRKIIGLKCISLYYFKIVISLNYIV